MIKRAKRAFSLSEIVFSMALIILLSTLGYMVCNISLSSRRMREQNLQIVSYSESLYSAFSRACIKNVNSEQREKDLLFDFNEMVAYVTSVTNFENEFASQTDDKWTLVADSENVIKNGESTNEKYLRVSFDIRESRGNPFFFNYVYKEQKFRIEFSVYSLGEKLYFSVKGYREGAKKSTYEHTGEF